MNIREVFLSDAAQIIESLHNRLLALEKTVGLARAEAPAPPVEADGSAPSSEASPQG
jgi:hypothetical protein